jgi:hypothetical protein
MVAKFNDVSIPSFHSFFWEAKGTVTLFYTLRLFYVFLIPISKQAHTSHTNTFIPVSKGITHITLF